MKPFRESVFFYLIKMDINLDTTYGYNNDIHKSKIIKYKPNNLATMNTVNTNINIIINREENHLNLRDSYLEIEFVVSDVAGGEFANDANIRLVNYGMMALFSSIKLETSGGRTIENIDHCHPNLFMSSLSNSSFKLRAFKSRKPTLESYIIVLLLLIIIKVFSFLLYLIIPKRSSSDIPSVRL